MSPTREVGLESLGRDDPVRLEPSIWEFDFHPPPTRAGLVVRQSLVDRLEEADADVITVIAPAGYGKTRTLAQWAATTRGGMAWLSLRPTDNDPTVLLLRMGAAVARARSRTVIDLDWMVRAGANTAQTNVVSLIRALGQMRQPSKLVLDNAHVVRSTGSKKLLRELIEQVEGRVQVVVSSRSEPDVPLAKLRASRALLELTQDDLALDESEVAQMLDLTGQPSWKAEDLTATTGGWPAAVSLLLVSDRQRSDDLAPTLEADHRFLADFVKSEILPQLSPRRRDFLMKVSPLERVNGSLADAVTQRHDSSDLLRRLATSTHLVHPVNAAGDWYTVNRVLLRVLRTEFETGDPAAVAATHAAAADWYRDHDMPLEAIGHAQRAGDPDRFVELMAPLVKERYASGHVADVLLWMDWLDANGSLDNHPGLAAIGALVLVQEGRVLDAERWLEVASKSKADPDTSTITRLVLAVGTRSGLEQMFKDLDAAQKTAPPGSRWTPAIVVTRGLAHVMQGDTDGAERCFVEAARLGVENGSLASHVLALGQRALIAIDRQDWELASGLSTQAMTVIDEQGLDGYHISAPALIAAARCARHSNDVGKTNALLARASLVRPRLSAAIPGDSVQILTEMARAYVELSDVAGARALIREADDILILRPDLGVLPDRLEALRSSLAALGPSMIGHSALTKAELRLLPFLATNLSFPEIGEQLYISRHTVKTQAMSIYRKLGASSRSEAVTRAYGAGLLQR